ncbi:BrnT family toxin [Fulvimarina sp. 2208YS6-2-32]|uniref:BrnT family toxin n=1 Tax=Fulvimarina uroteuthidis TaxID=3098149 RepID=A0ABU5HZ00_9HYPH|nr:BrnT family toxin [Fulvimarina sp. 2208YS6-2-32]MDY8108344.1 BrnT family toxin [Fulvimarina sp. 2208YS6-2-32]
MVRRQRNVDIVRAARIFENPVLQSADRREDYGEDRFIAIGFVDNEFYVVVWTPRGDRRRLITAWKAGSDERRAYRKRHP